MTTQRLVVVSNRVADPRKTAAGGLAVALGDALEQHRRPVVRLERQGRRARRRHGRRRRVHLHAGRPVTLATIDLSRERPRHLLPRLLATACCGRCSTTGSTWPTSTPATSRGYRRVNQLFARKLLPLLRPDDIIWVHDYHLIPLAAELRALGCQQRIGFFLHIPLPPPLILAAIPGHDWLMRALFAYDLVGFQSAGRPAPLRALRADRGARAARWATAAAAPSAAPCSAGAFPIGIDVDEFTALDAKRTKRATCTSACARVLAAQAAGGRRPARLLQGPAAAHARVSRAARAATPRTAAAPR